MNAKTILQANFFAGRRAFQRLLSGLDLCDRAERKRINEVCSGYSTSLHWRFFRWIMETHRPSNAAIAGVFHGRDCGYLCHLSNQHGDSEMRLTGVDLFASDALPDWSEEHMGKTWEENGFGTPPDLNRSRQNLEQLGFGSRINLLAGDAVQFFNSTDDVFDFIYIDTSHDYTTTLETIEAALPRLSPGGIIAGDDYLDFGMWGVRSAVARALPSHKTFCSGFIWYFQSGN